MIEQPNKLRKKIVSILISLSILLLAGGATFFVLETQLGHIDAKKYNDSAQAAGPSSIAVYADQLKAQAIQALTDNKLDTAKQLFQKSLEIYKANNDAANVADITQQIDLIEKSRTPEVAPETPLETQTTAS